MPTYDIARGRRGSPRELGLYQQVPFREYAIPPITMEEMERRWGPPVRTWQDEDRPFAEFATPDGILRLGLYQSKSGSYVSRGWRLSWHSHSADLSQILENSVLGCVSDLLRPDVSIVILGSEDNFPHISIELHNLELRQVSLASVPEN